MTHLTTLDGGLRVVTAEMPDRESVAVGVWLRCGSRDEPARLNGISHLIEHYVFKPAVLADALEALPQPGPARQKRLFE